MQPRVQLGLASCRKHFKRLPFNHSQELEAMGRGVHVLRAYTTDSCSLSRRKITIHCGFSLKGRRRILFPLATPVSCVLFHMLFLQTAKPHFIGGHPSPSVPSSSSSLFPTWRSSWSLQPFPHVCMQFPPTTNSSFSLPGQHHEVSPCQMVGQFLKTFTP